MLQQQCPAPWTLRNGARVVAGGGAEFRVWAPRLQTLAVRVMGEKSCTVQVRRGDNGEFSIVLADLRAGTDYCLVLPDGHRRPDPVSRSQPFGVHGPSRVVDPEAYLWTDAGWKGIPLRDYVIYELHTGTFTGEGTFDAVIPRLGYLRDLGITAIELMPVAEFPGARNWGYDGVCLYAPHSSYGGPTGLKRLVDACHREGLAVVLDVVYNHLGPEGNYLDEFAPYFTQRYQTPWGEAINFDGPDGDGVRRFFIDNALYWLTEYHIDALRLDAIHGIFDLGARHILEELADAFHCQAERLGRLAWVIAESDLNDVRVINPRSQGGYQVDAQWHDDFHHSLHTLLTGSRPGYLADFGKLADLAKAVREGFVYDGRYSTYRRRRHGSSSKDRPGEQFVAFIQNHDQIANACRGKRLSQLVSFEQQKLAAAVLLCSPCLPLLFMGQEYGETAPFLYFTSHGDPALVEAVREGRRKEFAAFQTEEACADPQAAETFLASKLDWSRAGWRPHVELLRFYKDLAGLRRRSPSLANCRKDLIRLDCDERDKWLVLERHDPSGDAALLVGNFSAGPQPVPIQGARADWSLAMWSGALEYGGNPAALPPSALISRQREEPAWTTLGAFEVALYTGQCYVN